MLVYRPPGYEAGDGRRYPVLYLHDGQNLFDGTTSFIPGQDWRVGVTAQRLITSGAIQPLIIVGIYNTGKDRIAEYTPAKDSTSKLGGGADLYGRMLVEELKPFIDANYRTLKHATHTGVGGSSLGGLVSLYLALKYPQVFGKVAAISPSVWFADGAILRCVNTLGRRPRLRIWLDTGTREGRNPAESRKALANVQMLRDALLQKGWKLGKDLRYFEAEGAEHSERAWAKRVGPLLEFLFAAG